MVHHYEIVQILLSKKHKKQCISIEDFTTLTTNPRVKNKLRGEGEAEGY